LEEFKTFISWIFNELNLLIEKWRAELVPIFFERWYEYIDLVEAFDYEYKLLTGLLAYSGGLRRELIALLRYDLLRKEYGQLGTLLQKEKVLRSNSKTIPLANQFEMYLAIFIAFVRKRLLKSNSPEGINL